MAQPNTQLLERIQLPRTEVYVAEKPNSSTHPHPPPMRNANIIGSEEYPHNVGVVDDKDDVMMSDSIPKRKERANKELLGRMKEQQNIALGEFWKKFNRPFSAVCPYIKYIFRFYSYIDQTI